MMADLTARSTYRDIRDRVLGEGQAPRPGDAVALRAAMCALADDPTCFTMYDAQALLAGWRDHPDRYLVRAGSRSEYRQQKGWRVFNERKPRT